MEYTYTCPGCGGRLRLLRDDPITPGELGAWFRCARCDGQVWEGSYPYEDQPTVSNGW